MNKRIIVLGDSIAEGDGSTDGEGWVGILRRKYWSQLIRITNLGVSGYSSEDILANPPSFPYIDKYIVAVGINDSAMVPSDNDHQSSLVALVEPEIFEKNIIRIIEKCSKDTKNIIIVGLTSVNETLVQPLPSSKRGKSFSNERIRMYNGILEESANKKDTTFISPIHLLKPTDLYDGIHPNNGGYTKMATFFEQKEHNLPDGFITKS